MQEKNKSNWSTPLFYAFLVIMGVVIGVFFKGSLPLNILAVLPFPSNDFEPVISKSTKGTIHRNPGIATGSKRF